MLIFAAVSSLRFGRIDTTMRAGLPSRVALVATFAATLFLPVPAAVGIGVVLSLLLQLNQEAVDLTVVRMATGADGQSRRGARARDPAFPRGYGPGRLRKPAVRRCPHAASAPPGPVWL